MIKIEKDEVYGWQEAIRGMRNPMNSWDKSDSGMGCRVGRRCESCALDLKLKDCIRTAEFKVGENDRKLMTSLVKAGTDHSKFMRFITVTMDITAPLYWWKEFDTYKVGTVANSCSTMHRIHVHEFKLDDFSHEHLFPLEIQALQNIIEILNSDRCAYNEIKDKDYWWQIIQLLPTSYMQKRTVQLNYAVLREMYHSRKNHKLDEWNYFCGWMEGLPYAFELIGERGGRDGKDLD